MSSKVLLVTNAVALQLLSLAATLQMDSPQVDDIAEIESFTIRHLHDHGVQTLNADRIHANLFVISFVGHQDFLDKIESDGWVCSIDTLILYLEKELSVEIGEAMPLDLHNSSVGLWSKIENGEGDFPYLLFATGTEDYVDVLLNEDEVQRLLAVHALNQQFGEVIGQTVDDIRKGRVIDDSVASYTSPEESADGATEETPVDAYDSLPWKEKVGKFATSTVGQVVIGATLIAAAVGIGSFLFSRDTPTEV